MFEKVLLPTDFSAYADRTLADLIDIPGVAEVVLLHVRMRGLFPAGNSQGNDEVPALLAERVATLGKAGLHVRSMVEDAPGRDIPGTILRVCERERPSLVMIGGRGRGIVTGYLLGSVSRELLLRSKTDLLITRSMGNRRSRRPSLGRGGLFSKVLCPVDFSRPSMETVHALQSIPGVNEVILLHVIRSAESRDELEARFADADARCTEIERHFGGLQGISHRIHLGRPGDEIAAAASKEKVSLIWLSRYGSTEYLKRLPIGSVTSEVAERVNVPVCIRYSYVAPEVNARELQDSEYPLAEDLWIQYHQQRVDPATDRIFGAFLDSALVAIARCRRHPDGHEVDGVFTPAEFRGHGYAKRAVAMLVRECGHRDLYMHSVTGLVPFYREFGFEPIHESRLPPTIRERFSFAMGELSGSDVVPMHRKPG